MATSMQELYRVEQWRYRAEGNANLVLQYIGPDPRFKTTLLRLRKTDRQITEKTPDSDTATAEAPIDGHATETNDVSSESLFASKVMGLLLGQEFIEQLIPISLPKEFLRELAETIEPSRPEGRLHKAIDHSQITGFLVLDHTRFIKPSAGQPSVAVEIKPKWGFLTQSGFICKDNDIKRRKCRFCMYQHRKIKLGQEDSLSEFCPIDLFSGEPPLVRNALDSLVRTPQNNLRLFVDGEIWPISNEAMLQCLSGPGSAPKKPQRADSQTDVQERPLETSLTEVLVRILVQSPLLRRLGRLQQALDSLDVETIHRFYAQLVDPAMGILPEPTLEEFLDTANSFLYRTDMNEMMDMEHEIFATSIATSLGFGPEDDLDNPNTVPASLKLHYIREFLLSATLKDCSILITVRREDQADQIIEDVGTSSITRNGSSLGVGILEFSENYRKIRVNNEDFIYKITCIDLDPKKIVSVPMYLKKDRDIVGYYLSIVGDRQQRCGSR
ncbi:inositol-pentakisphosphate 2-kinase [Gamsiella multidivaricata]|uniref:inositol-pentakisphosphate 2-kinase n=1 Tax=Gamsiella multidivaricata TaxID=101098 RepID=UPI0022203B96|nr:inositol-pentakisphosphate 2-kinase [Gamsiella multidivaricata]KAI7829832.1 inositol-pentakisphosphate 2-kinase [Gamsiella multidivaricata]